MVGSLVLCDLPPLLFLSNVLRVFRSGAGGDRQGLGTETGELNEDDDEFDTYRKRMMLAYRFRPNPLVWMDGCSRNALTICPVLPGVPLMDKN